MGLRGPKPVDTQRLKAEATMWATFFYNLRDGQPGLAMRVKYEAATQEQLQKINWYRFTKRHPETRKPQFARYLEPPIIIPVSEAARALPSKIRAEGWIIDRPLQPAPEL